MNAHNSTRAPRRGILAVRAQPADNTASTVQMLQELNQDWTKFKAAHIAELDSINTRLAGAQLNASGPVDLFRPQDPEYSEIFANWLRDGRSENELRDAQREGMRASIQASLNVGTPAEGGYLAPTEWDRRVHAELEPLSPMRQLATVVQTTVGAFSTLWNLGGWVSGWVNETAARPETAAATIAQITFSHGEIYANPAVTQRLLDDADFNTAAFLTTQIAEEFAKQEDSAFLTGDGTNKPRGLLTYVPLGASAGHHPGGNLTIVNSGAASALTADGLVDFVYSLPSTYRRNASWLMNSTTAATIARMKDGQGNYLWRESYVAGQPATLLGYAVAIDENMADVAADALPVAFGDFKRGYVINDRQGVRMLRDPYTNKPYVHFYSTKRVGGGVMDPFAIRLLKVAA